MKKYLYWTTFPISVLMFMIFTMTRDFSETIVEGLHKFEGWCLDYKKRFPHMRYKGDGIWTSFKE